MTTSKKSVQLIAEVCKRKGIRYAVFSPGSRSAPLVIAFSAIPEIACIVIPDERVAGYFALGMAQQLREPVAVVCTSGTAVLNLLPAACEASYQFIPLVFITADRPVGAEYKGDNQAINQDSVFENYAFEYIVDAEENSLSLVAKTVGEAIAHAVNESQPSRINVRIAEPLYETAESFTNEFPEKILKAAATENEVKDKTESRELLKEALNKYGKKLIILGLREPESEFKRKLISLAARKDVVVLAESAANVSGDGIISNYDACLEMLSNENAGDFVPDIVITFGVRIISKRIREFLRGNKPKQHWDIPACGDIGLNDYFEMLDECNSDITEGDALECFYQSEENVRSTYSEVWQSLHQKAKSLSEKYFSAIPFCDAKVFQTLVQSFPDGANIQYGNSTPVRYANFFEHKKLITINANRGASGIDGCVSTAAGAAYANSKLTVCTVGDVSFFYDSNALWNNYLSPDLRIVIINNSGGNIFRWLEGAARLNDFEKFFETKHNLHASHLADMYSLPYYICATQNELEEILKTFYSKSGSAKILEIKTDGVLSADVYKKYFEYLRRNK